MKALVAQEIIEDKILLIRGKKVILDRDLAKLYGVETAQLKRQVKRNIERFPEDFMFVLTKQELKNWRCQFGTSKSIQMGLRYFPIVFTEQGVAMLSSVLNTRKAIQVNIAIMRAFVKIREIALTHKAIAKKLEELERGIEGNKKSIKMAFAFIYDMLDSKKKGSRIIEGFSSHKKAKK
ncbi:MAG: ORF6N domain-containing protein [Candidatus Omnitrophica bacterium]|nr:ORF6N domain-containing protein [Candidatus Omnitrophota bacterium]